MLQGFYRWWVLHEEKEIGSVVARTEDSARRKALLQFWRIKEGYRGLYPSFKLTKGKALEV